MQTNNHFDHLPRSFDVGQPNASAIVHLQQTAPAGKYPSSLLLAIAGGCVFTASELASAVINSADAAWLVDQIDGPNEALSFIENEAEKRDDVSPEAVRDAVLILLSWVEDRVAEFAAAEEREARRAIAEGEAYEDGNSIEYENFFDRYAAV